jgi:hypothetical protein
MSDDWDANLLCLTIIVLFVGLLTNARCFFLHLKHNRFNQLSDTIIGRIDDMGTKIDELERSVNEMMNQVGLESTPSDKQAKSDSKGGNNE